MLDIVHDIGGAEDRGAAVSERPKATDVVGVVM
ncbi:MAG: hypothetical protein ACJA2W_004013 [Planctomycetota bacterium]|jgi:hypothetical protein